MTAIFCFGRFNPPTKGHAKQFEYMLDQGDDVHIFISQKRDDVSNPITTEHRKQLIDSMLYNIDRLHGAEVSDECSDPFSAISYLTEEGYSELVYVAGSDYVDDGGMFERMKAFAAKQGATLTASISGEREIGVSASDMRAAAQNKDLNAFINVAPAVDVVEVMQLWNALLEVYGNE